jgi:glycosyltransferase involved in cell wall biosynthesis
LLDAYEVQGDVGPFEIIAVDDGSTDETYRLLTSWRTSRFSLVVERQSHQGPAAARNRALGKARGTLVVFTGDDIVPHPEMLKSHLQNQERLANDDLAVLGLTTWPQSETTTATMRHIDGIGGEQFAYHYISEGMLLDFRFFYTSNLSIGRRQIQAMEKWFDTDFPDAAYEDIEFAYRLFGDKKRIYYSRAPRAEHHHFYDVRKFAERQYRCGQSAAYLVKKWPHLIQRLGTRVLRRLRLESLWGLRREKRVGRLWASLYDMESSVVNLVSSFDDQENDDLTEVRRMLFLYFYVKGLVDQTLENEPGSRLLAYAMTHRVLKSIRTWASCQNASTLGKSVRDEALRAYLRLPALSSV